MHKVLYMGIYNTYIYTAIKKNKIMPFTATWMQVEIIIVILISEVRKTNTI